MCKCCERRVVTTDRVPKAIGPYSVGIQGGHFVFSSGQIGIDPVSGNLVEGGVENETHQTLKNLGEVLKAAGTDLEHVVKTTVFLRNMGDFSKMNAVYAQYFPNNPPARSAFQVADLPKGAELEIEAIAIIPCKEGECNCK